MAVTSYPFDGLTITEDQYSRFFREIIGDGVVAGVGATDLQVTASGSSMVLTIAAGSAVVRGHFIRSDASATVTIAGGSASARTDIVVLRLDPVANTITFQVVQGTSGGPVPALTKTDTGVYEFALCQVAVPASASTLSSSNLTDLRYFTDQRVGTWSTANRPTTPRLGRLGYNTTVGILEIYNGSTWVNPIAVLPVGAIVGTTDTQTLSNKRITPRVATIASSATPAINVGTCDIAKISALAANITSMSTGLTGTPTDGQKLVIQIKDTGSARTIAWGSAFAARGSNLPTTTTAGKWLRVGLTWNADAGTWDCVAVVAEI